MNKDKYIMKSKRCDKFGKFGLLEYLIYDNQGKLKGKVSSAPNGIKDINLDWISPIELHNLKLKNNLY